MIVTMSSYVGLNVGGRIYLTSRTTLTIDPNSFFSMMLNESIPSARDEHGNYIIDRDAEIFRHVLNFMRCGKLVLPDSFPELRLLESEADFFQLRSLKATIAQLCQESGYSTDEFISLNVGGKVFMTTRETLNREPDSEFANMLSGKTQMPSRDRQGTYLFDRNCDIFSYVLDFLRRGHLSLTCSGLDSKLDLLADEAEFFRLSSLREQIESLLEILSNPRSRVIHLYCYSWNQFAAYGEPSVVARVFSFLLKMKSRKYQYRLRKVLAGTDDKLSAIVFKLEESLAEDNLYYEHAHKKTITLHRYPKEVGELISILRTEASSIDQHRIHEHCLKLVIAVP